MTLPSFRLYVKTPVAIGDVHGCLDLLELAVARFPDQSLVFLGDYIDRGPDSRGVLRLVRKLVEAGRAVALMGNHDLWMTEVLLDGQDPTLWYMNGGEQTMQSYEGNWAEAVADAQWMRDRLHPYVTAGNVLFSHAMRPHESDVDAHIWGRPGETPFHPLPEGVKYSVHGHTALQACPFPIGLEDGTIAWFIDTGAVFTGVLCALDTETWTAHLIRRTS